MRRAQQMFARFVPAPQIHHGHARLIMFFRRAHGRSGLLGHALFDNAQMNPRAVRQFLARAGFDLFEQFFCLHKFLLVEMLDGLLVHL